ncbi:aftiphilin isoform X2 [Candoia aspera]|uniref:aftiphilin isoform X2 n=1 Tax=Candoia aspera TaxID=51853 RepID=UPI002FD7FCB1
MEPDIVRMYSSSPPPLDNGPDEEEEEEEEEFGDFGGFSDVGSTSVSFDFTSEYSSSKEEHKSSFNSDYSGRVDSVITFTTIRYSNTKDSIAELPSSIKELPDSTKEKCECRNLGTSFDDVIPVEITRAGILESSYSEIIRTDLQVPSEDQQIDTCNGERLLCPEVLTNGFSEPDTASSQGVEDLDNVNDPKGLKTISIHSTELNLDSVPSTEENFATFSHKQTTQVEETKNKICKYFSEKELLNAQENYVNRIGEAESMKEATLEESCEHEGETFTEGEQICISKTNLVINNVKAEKDIVSSVQINVNSVGTIENTEESGECGTGNNKEHTLSWTSDAAKTADLSLSRLESLSSLPSDKKVNDSEVIKNGESDPGHASCSDVSEDDFGDFSIVSNGSLAFADSVQASASQEHFQPPFENLSRLSNECSESTANSLHQQSTKVAPGQPNEISSTLLEEHPMVDSGFSKNIKPSVELENGDDNEFGDFDSGTKRFPDSDEFSDFSSAGCNQATEWNAFEIEQKESCLWATFEDEQMVESHPREDVWPSHTVGTTYAAEDSVNPTMNSVQTGSEQSQELRASAQVVLLNRLERIFEACFPPVLVSEMKEEIPPLNLLLEVSRKAERTVENLSERELLDVWAELQDIHDAYGLRYQWGGSHSNKKLLCSLGIDTRNILFTGNKKQPVIVPMYAAGLGMLEPTKEPMKPISAAEKIASIGQTSAISPEINLCTPDQLQESLPPVQFDWSSSGLTNPLDGVDPELYELTTSKLETSKTTSKVTDAFAKLMSTVEKASTSASQILMDLPNFNRVGASQISGDAFPEKGSSNREGPSLQLLVTTFHQNRNLQRALQSPQRYPGPKPCLPLKVTASILNYTQKPADNHAAQ